MKWNELSPETIEASQHEKVAAWQKCHEAARTEVLRLLESHWPLDLKTDDEMRAASAAAELLRLLHLIAG